MSICVLEVTERVELCGEESVFRQVAQPCDTAKHLTEAPETQGSLPCF